jgi:hypothetical protein
VQKRRKPESSEATAARKRRQRERERREQERELWISTWLCITGQDGLPRTVRNSRIADWQHGTGQDWLTPAKRLALNAWLRDTAATATNRPYLEAAGFPLIIAWRYPRLPRHLPLPVTGEPQKAKLAAALRWEHFGSADYSLNDDVAALYYHGRGWGRHTRLVTFKDGKCRRVPAARAAGKARSIPITVDLDRLYRGALVWEYQRWRWRERGDWGPHKWDAPELSTWRCKVNRGYLKLPLPGAVVDLSDFTGVRWWSDHYRLWSSSLTALFALPVSDGQLAFYRECADRICREPIAHDWGERFDPENSGVSRRCRVPKLFNQVLRRLERDVEKECADAIDDDCNVDGRRLSRPFPYDPKGRRVVLEFFSDGSLAVHWECEKRNRARMRGNIPFISTTKACSGIVGCVQLSPGWAARPPIPNAYVALVVLRSGKLPTVKSVKAYWWKRLGMQAVEIEARALHARCETLRPPRAFCELMQRKEKSWYKDLRVCHVGGATAKEM